jgi:hypothetical protein
MKTRPRLLYSLIPTGLIFATLTGSTFARLGEDETRLVERYGKVIMRSPESVIEQGKIYTLADDLHFQADGWNIIGRLVNGRCESITYGKPGEWTEEQFRRLLEMNGGRSQWEERRTPTPKTHREWKRRDGGTAVWRMLQGVTLDSPAYPKARDALKKRAKEETSKLPKF